MKKFAGALLVGAMGLSACAQSSANIAPAYVSPMQFADYSCSQIADEARRVSARAAQAMGTQDQQAANDQAAMAVGMILFWPALFALGGNSNANEAEVARLRGEMQALEQANIQRNCGIEFQTTPT